MKWPFRKRALSLFLVGVLFTTIAAVMAGRASMADWRTASRESAGIAPDPERHSEAIAQVYAARAYGWRGTFGVHTWIAVKPSNADRFTVYEVIGWRVMHGGNAVSISQRPADGRWFGNMPEIIADIRGDGVDEVIGRIHRAAMSYPYENEYRVWPGPNSNTFTAHVGRAVPELKLDLPPTAIGKDHLTNGDFYAQAPSGTGYQVSLFGLLGLMASAEEGLELNLLGLTFGFDAKNPALKLPLAGRVGSGNL